MNDTHIDIFKWVAGGILSGFGFIVAALIKSYSKLYQQNFTNLESSILALRNKAEYDTTSLGQSIREKLDYYQKQIDELKKEFNEFERECRDRHEK